MKTSEKILVFGVIVGNRDVFPDRLAKEGRVEIISVLKDLGYSYVILNDTDTKDGVVESYPDAKKYAELFKKNRDSIIKIIVGLPFPNLFHGECGIYNIKLFEKHEPTPATLISVIAGVYSVIQFILIKLGIQKGSIIESVAEFNAFTYPNENCLIRKKRNLNCVCNDLIYQEVFKNK